MSPSFQRARSPAAKAERRAQILAAAAAELDRGGWEDLTMAGVARRAGVAKGTPYRYFETKEALFLALLLEDLGAWADSVARELPAEPVGAPRVGAILARSLATRDRLQRLLGLLHAVLERNVGAEAVTAFKGALLELVLGLEPVLEAAVPLPEGSGARALLRTHALVVGLSQMARPAPAVAEVLDARPELAPFRLELESELAECLAAILAAAASG